MKLREYQRKAVRAIVSEPGDRALCVAACGTGKTLIAAHAAAELLAGGPGAVLIVFPTLGLLEQTYTAWRAEAPLDFAALAVCSTPIRGSEDIRTEELSIQSTTSPADLAQWRERLTGTGVVFCTYQSLPVITAAHAQFGMAEWAALLIDEAHRAAGRAGRPFAAALDGTAIPAAHRWFFTATPKIHAGDRRRRGVVASMDDPTLFGRQVFTLSTRAAIEQGILSPFKVAVIGVSNRAVAAALKDLRTVRLAGGHDDVAERADHVAAAIALSQAATDYGLSSVLAFHNTIASSAEFAATFRRTHALLRAQGLLRDDRAVSVCHIDGGTPLSGRLAATQSLAVEDPSQWNIVTNARCLTEGINIPALDAVFFAEPRSSQVDVAQAVGRAIRKHPSHDRPALIVLAVTVNDTEDAESVIHTSEFARVRQVLHALQTHDPSLSRNLAEIRDRLAQTKPKEHDPLEGDILDIHLPKDLPAGLADQFLRAFSVHTVDALTAQWEETYRAAAAFAAEHGHCRIPANYRTDAGIHLASWMQNQRTRHAQGLVAQERVERLERLPGWTWQVLDDTWERYYRALRRFAGETGHACPAVDYRADRLNLGNWASAQRRLHTLGKLAADRARRLDELPGWTWDAIASRWDANFADAARYAAVHGRPPPQHYRSAAGFALGQWISDQRRRWEKLSEERQRRLESLPGWTWDRRAALWDEGAAALEAFAAEHGHANPPRREPWVALNQWVLTQRRPARRARLQDDQRRRLEAIPGWTWAPRQRSWQDNLTALTDYLGEYHSDPPADYVAADGFALGRWSAELHTPSRRRRLSAAHQRELEALPGWTWH